MQANRRGLLKQKKQEKTRNKLRWKPSSALLVADRNRVSGFGQRLRLSMTGCPRRCVNEVDLGLKTPGRVIRDQLNAMSRGILT
jgi:hypothetical protein